MLRIDFLTWLDKIEARLAVQNDGLYLRDDPTLTMGELRAWFDSGRDAVDVALEIVGRIKRN